MQVHGVACQYLGALRSSRIFGVDTVDNSFAYTTLIDRPEPNIQCILSGSIPTGGALGPDN